MDLKSLTYARKNAWEAISEKEEKDLTNLVENYRGFISEVKTEREYINKTVAEVKKLGFKDLNFFKTLKTGDKFYSTAHGKAMIIGVIGKDDIEKGMNIVGGHIDSPRIDLKQNPLYEDSNLALLKTHYYGGIRKYQWVAIPLALHGVVVKKDGEVIDVSVGENPKDPVFYITDLLPHLAADQSQKTLANGITGEGLNVFIGSKPYKGKGAKDVKDKVKINILKILNEKYGMTEEDFLSAELEIVPAGEARFAGLDSSMIVGYGHDDRVCSWTAMKALFDIKNPKKTVLTILADKEEVGSHGATGMDSNFFENVVYEMAHKIENENPCLIARRALANSKMLSSDVVNGFDPNFPEVSEKANNAMMGFGVSITKYTGSRGKSGANDANPEFIAELRKIFDKEKIIYQTAELGKVDQGGGGTIAYLLAKYGMQVVDIGVPLLAMHAPMEMASNVDIYMTFKAYKAFYNC